MVYTSVEKPSSYPALKWDDIGNMWDEADLSWDASGYPDIDKPIGPVYGYLPFFDAAYFPFLDTGHPFERLGSYEMSAPSYTSISKPT